jgi:response regulator of citrate/malate metabolism
MRRDPLEIVEKMLEILEKEKEALTVNQLAHKSGLHNITVKRYVQIIQTIREEPGLDVIRTSRSIIIRMDKRKDKGEWQ